ncbi:MAG: hypothetical protein A3G47_01640 [Candidatus Zambryskibacteria bacterium RIFCSPLOWO2_12_FULL_39_45]|uniref:isoleucine--tRNA ligase n=2 Tax=Candidatus Zambryskiibacteriota TaxID=1817925 RepID=A0A1G2TAT3_9BACT|nr:MAG: hypothetical protein A2W58_00815 [Candidatus Zambryskibacteria bacterium RIFCSPHIGHO2_02_38_10.5]OHA95720.1 MAG: hypothetical protein A3C63_00585 [Candidatus Zambryskibacteria bacterium RIFCSPHIGHO2_02_FULL_39_82]OHA97853.1 MAG: hypothetical protein A3E32_02645 [Candidatus Zambryskibacteria bacterium RIFCSPHIGHO2_12_FULL_38_37]OHB10281.1 MAG: hypothetical protein A3I21_01325 [Candidatus Zambryskibacteria bacterium RIFCSPLOWO2_02_FULL_39_69]OHB13668.1 MAG: hypothetical protein A3G47_0164
MEEEKNTKSEITLREEKILEFWKEHKIFEKSLKKPSPNGEFVFYDGPVTANSAPVLHTMEPFAFKDIIPRYKTMCGFHVARKGGWDTHGLPVELQIEKKLGFKSKKDIEDYGIEQFNKLCKDSVWEHIDLWKNFTSRMGYWADQEHPYVTYDNSYIESVWNIVKIINDKKLLYKDYKVLPWCPRCGTALSSHELAQGYEQDKDLAVFVKFPISNFQFPKDAKTFLLAWTTTPWTLPGNVALAVGEDIDYVKIKFKDEFLILAKSCLSIVESEYEIVEEMKGSQLVGLTYEPLYNFLSEKFKNKNPEAFEKSYKVYAADFVNTEEGTGIVHTAVMYGQDDFVLGTKVGLPKYHLVKEDGHFLDEMQLLSGDHKLDLSNRFVKDEEVAVDIIKDLAHRGLLFKKEKYEHSYPHCWRCKTSLIYYARDSWYIKMSSLREELVKENEGIHWEPEYIKEGRFGEWLREIKDWAISRERYWGTPLPVWRRAVTQTDADLTQTNADEYIVVGSIDELKKYTKKSGNKYFVMRHGEAIDNVKNILDPKGDPDNHLTETGKKEIISASKELKQKNIDIIITSPFLRTRETAEVVRCELNLHESTVIVDERLHEFNESGVELVRKRMGKFIFETENRYTGKNILIISHGNPLWVLHKIVTWQPSNDFVEQEMLHTAEVREIPFTLMPHNENYEPDLHRPFIDQVELVDENGEPLTRVKEVMDVWFDSGAMPFAQAHYPFETTDKDLLYPADYIAEAIDQTRGWFYTLHAIGVLMGKGKAYKNVICLGHILDEKGKKMSKSLGNIVEPEIMLEKYGADALRLWMYSVNQPGDSKNFDEKTVDEIVKKVFNPAENILAFYDLYKDETFVPSDKSQNILDRWIIVRLYEMVSCGTKSLDQYKIFEAARVIREFVNDFSTWYIRRSRERFKSENVEERKEALQTTRFVFLELVKYMAPFTPFFAENSYLRLKMDSDLESVHLCNWPNTQKVEHTLIQDMQKVRQVVTSALELRQKFGYKVRQPLTSLTIPNDFTQELLDVIADEVNVKEVKIAEGEIKLDTNLTDELIEEGKVRDAIRAIQEWRKEKKIKPGEVTQYSMPESEKEFFIKHAEEIKKATNIEF